MRSRRSAKWVSTLLVPLCLIALTGCPELEDLLNGDGAAGFPVPTISEDSVLLVVFNNSGEAVNVQAQFISETQPVRETNLALTATGAESEAALLRTVADQIDVTVVVAGRARLPESNARLAEGFVLFQQSFILGVDYAGGDTITVEIPFVGEDCNDNQILDEDEVADGSAPDCNSNGIPDECDVALGVVGDVNTNGVPDVCENEAPTILEYPESDEVATDESCAGVVPDLTNDVVVEDDFTSAAALSRSQTPAAGTPLSFNVETIVTVTMADAAGLTSTCQIGVTLRDKSEPLLSLPVDAIVECDASTSPEYTGVASASDYCDAEPLIDYEDSFESSETTGVCSYPYTIERTWTAVDASGNVAEDVQTITVVDSTPPVIFLPDDASIECDGERSPDVLGYASASDNCDSQPQVSYADSAVASCTDPVLLYWPALHPCPAEISEDPMPGGGPGASFGRSEEVDSSCLIVVERTWTATDACGNSASEVQYITVADTTPPVLTAPADITISCGTSTLPSNTGMATAEDPCDPSASVSYQDSYSGSCPVILTRTWYTSDVCGNETSAVQTITIEDSAAPILTLPADVEVEIGESTDPADTGSATAYDVCDSEPSVSYEDEFIDGSCPGEGTIERTWTATDACENSTSVVQYISVVLGQIGPRLYVDPSASSGENDGTSWDDALLSLEVALDLAACSGDVTDIWVAQGYYVPEVLPERAGDTRDMTFAIPAGVSVVGSFRGGSCGGKCDPNDRDFVNTRTILSGEIGTTSSEDNCYHVVTSMGGGASLDGITIVHGNADTEGDRGQGGGVFVAGSGDLSLMHCSFYGNAAGQGGAIAATGLGFVNLTNCLVDGNDAQSIGGGVYVGGDSGLRAYNCTIASNAASGTSGGAGIAAAGTCIVKNSIIYQNFSDTGSALASQILITGGTPASVFYSCIQDDDPGSGDVPFGGATNGNIDGDPLFADRIGSDETRGTLDDDLRLDAGSPCIDAADTSVVTASLLIDLWNATRVVDDPYTADTGFDSSNPPVVDMGAYEYQPPTTDPFARVYWTIFDHTDGEVRSAKLDGTDIQTHLTGEIEPADIVLDASAGRMYVRRDGEYTGMFYADLDGSNRTTFGVPIYYGSQELALDPVAGYVLWPESRYDQELGSYGVILRASAGDTSATELLASGISEGISGIATNIAMDTLCWTLTTEGGTQIVVATLAGADDMSIYSSSNYLTDPEIVPAASGRPTASVFWIEEDYSNYATMIKKASINGSGVMTVHTFASAYIDAIAVDSVQGKLYWTDRLAGAIKRSDLDGSNIETVVSDQGSVSGVAIYYTYIAVP